MDRTLKRAKRRNKRRVGRNGGAWEPFCPDGIHCRFCSHDGSRHFMSSGQPHFFRPATEQERRDPHLMLYRHRFQEGGSVPGSESGTCLGRRVTVANRAELITAYCAACSEDVGTSQVLCYQRNLAIGEVVGLEKTLHKEIAVAA